MCGLWAVMWIFAGNIVSGAPLNLFEFGCCSPSFFVAYLLSRCYSNRIGSSVRIFGNISWWKERYYSRYYYWENKLPKSSKVYFSKVTTLLKILLMFPATSTVSERSALTLRRIKNWFQTSMTQGRLNHCMLLAIYEELMDKLSLINVVADEFCFGSAERSRLFSYFCQYDLRFKVCTF